jgi:hypothetical protein
VKHSPCRKGSLAGSCSESFGASAGSSRNLQTHTAHRGPSGAPDRAAASAPQSRTLALPTAAGSPAFDPTPSQPPCGKRNRESRLGRRTRGAVGCKLSHRRCRIEQSVTGEVQGCMLPENTTAVKALYSLVRMPLCKHGSRKAIEHWRGSCGTPLGQNPRIGQPGLSC